MTENRYDSQYYIYYLDSVSFFAENGNIMKRIIGNISIFTALFLITIPFTTAAARGKATMMGQLKTVSTDGPFDVIRNPAAMAFNGTSAGIQFGISPYTGNESSITNTVALNNSVAGDFTVTSADAGYNLTDSTMFAQEFALAISFTDKITFGIGEITGFQREESVSTFNVVVSLPVADTLARSQNEETDTTTFLTYASLGIRLTDTMSLGFNFNFGIRSSNTRANTSLSFSTMSQTSSVDNSTDSMWGEVTAAFLHKGNRHQTGVNIYSGRYSGTRFSYHDSLNDITTPANNYDISANVPYSGSYSSGAGLVAGHYWRFNSLIAAAVEAGIGIPNEFTFTTLHSGNGFYYNAENIMDENISFLVSAGLELNILKNLTIAFGGSYQNSSGTSKHIVNETGIFTQNDRTKFNIHAINSTAGISLEVLPGMEVIFSALAVYLRQSSTADSVQTEIDTSTTTITTNTETLLETVQVAFSLAFVKMI